MGLYSAQLSCAIWMVVHHICLYRHNGSVMSSPILHHLNSRDFADTWLWLGGVEEHETAQYQSYNPTELIPVDGCAPWTFSHRKYEWKAGGDGNRSRFSCTCPDKNRTIWLYLQKIFKNYLILPGSNYLKNPVSYSHTSIPVRIIISTELTQKYTSWTIWAHIIWRKKF